MPRLPFVATRVVKGSRVLAAGAKMVWLEDWALDQGLEGAWISASNLAARLGMSRQHVDQQRHALQHLGLYTVIPRPGARTVGWRPTLPTGCLPPSGRPTPEQLLVCVTALDMILSTTVDGGVKPSLHARQPQLTAPSTPVDNHSPEARADGGVRGGISDLGRGRETTLQPVVDSKDGEVACATEGRRTPEDGGARARHTQGVRPPARQEVPNEPRREARRENLDPETAATYAKWAAKVR